MCSEKDEWYKEFCESRDAADVALSESQKIPLHLIKKMCIAQFNEDKTERIWATDVQDVFLKKSEYGWEFYNRCAEAGCFEKIDARWVKDDICTDEPYLWTERNYSIFEAIRFFRDYVSDNDIYTCRCKLTIQDSAENLINKGAELAEILGRVGISCFKVDIYVGGKTVQVSKI